MRTITAAVTLAAASAAILVAGPALAQDQGEPGVPADVPTESIFDGDYVTLGFGAAYGPSYTGSDDYQVFVLPIVQGSLGGIAISPRPAGIAVDLVPDGDTGPNFAFGPMVKLNRDRVNLDDIDDPVVAAYGELDTAVEVGASAGISLPAVLNPYDSLSFTVDAVWDVAGAHGGRAINPSVSYFTPLSRGIAAALSVGATHIDDDYADYYYSVPAFNTLLPAADVLPGFSAEGGFQSVGVNTLVAFDLDGDVTNGGLSIIGIGGYSRLLGDAKRSPFTSIRGTADQFLAAAGVAYTF